MKIVPCPSEVKPGAVTLIRSPSVSTSAIPEMMIEDASVPTMALIRPTVVMKPLTMPSPRPESAPSMSARVGLM